MRTWDLLRMGRYVARELFENLFGGSACDRQWLVEKFLQLIGRRA